MTRYLNATEVGRTCASNDVQANMCKLIVLTVFGIASLLAVRYVNDNQFAALPLSLVIGSYCSDQPQTKGKILANWRHS